MKCWRVNLVTAIAVLSLVGCTKQVYISSFDPIIPVETPITTTASPTIPGASSPYLPKGERVRDQFPHWSDLEPPAGCDTRDELLQDAALHITKKNKKGCVLQLMVIDPYTGLVASGDREIQIDHILSLNKAWFKGAYLWDEEKRELFANDKDNLVVTTSTQNSRKSDKGPDEWRPADRSYWCEYGTRYRGVLLEWNLSATETELAAINELVSTC
jgi:Protein of unknown function (DUF1524)